MKAIVGTHLYEVVCWRCGSHEAFEARNAAAQELARARGWERDTSGLWLCSDCDAKRETEEGSE